MVLYIYIYIYIFAIEIPAAGAGHVNTLYIMCSYITNIEYVLFKLI